MVLTAAENRAEVQFENFAARDPAGHERSYIARNLTCQQ